jgi:hypothetical protein
MIQNEDEFSLILPGEIMLKAGRIALAVLAAFFGSASASAQAWEVIKSKDAITDEVSRETCSTQSQFRLCLRFEDSGVWATMRSLGPDLFDAQLFPALRIDQNMAVEGVNSATLDLERALRTKIIPRSWQPSYVTWRAQVPSPSGEWTRTPPLLISQMITGKSLLVRVYLSGGLQKDLTYGLDGFCTAAAQVYAKSAPLVCS